jgi:MoaA/NifB/PqqE/SkfB family radical SAM enzyme
MYFLFFTNGTLITKEVAEKLAQLGNVTPAISVEGFEKEVLEGALETLNKNNYPPILFESWGNWKEGVDKIKADLFIFLKDIYRI